jgi:hypothetical protein
MYLYVPPPSFGRGSLVPRPVGSICAVAISLLFPCLFSEHLNKAHLITSSQRVYVSIRERQRLGWWRRTREDPAAGNRSTGDARTLGAQWPGREAEVRSW